MSERHASGFEVLGLIPPLLKALREEGYLRPTPIQAKSIPHILDGKDLLGCAQTGTGKTAAFALPVLQRLYENIKPGQPSKHGHSAAHPAPPATHTGHAHPAPHAPHAPRARHTNPAGRPIRVLVLSPTRELSAQIGASFAAYGRHVNMRHTVIFGGVGQSPQASALYRGVDIVVATPGRLLDLMEQRLVDLRDLEILVLDEADRMLDMGFMPDVRRIVEACPADRQTLFFSATLAPEIQRIARNFIRDPIRVEVTPAATTVEAIEQRLYMVEKHDKIDLLLHLLKDPAVQRTIVFTRTKHGADKVDLQLHRAGVPVLAIHGNKSQNARKRALEQFRSGEVRVLVATDIAARGLDIDNVTHVINFDLPVDPEAYVHRIGRTGRAEAAGAAFSFCTPAERQELRDIERMIRIPIPVVRDATFQPTPAHLRPAPSYSNERGHDRGHDRGQGRGRERGQERSYGRSRESARHPRQASHSSHASHASHDSRPRQDSRSPEDSRHSRSDSTHSRHDSREDSRQPHSAPRRDSARFHPESRPARPAHQESHQDSRQHSHPAAHSDSHPDARQAPRRDTGRSHEDSRRSRDDSRRDDSHSRQDSNSRQDQGQHRQRSVPTTHGRPHSQDSRNDRNDRRGRR